MQGGALFQEGAETGGWGRRVFARTRGGEEGVCRDSGPGAHCLDRVPIWPPSCLLSWFVHIACSDAGRHRATRKTQHQQEAARVGASVS